MKKWGENEREGRDWQYRRGEAYSNQDSSVFLFFDCLRCNVPQIMRFMIHPERLRFEGLSVGSSELIP